ncbi:YozQ family protein [Mesobacillus thioparans]|uniref:YozQ family protein n=1 Tax=Mesobacillus thioparans TaxID=370439 RepID=UPI0039EE2DDB
MEKDKSKRTEVAGRMYETADYQRDDELSKGLAMTHEQASDSYAEGEVGGKVERKSDANDELNRRGYQ